MDGKRRKKKRTRVRWTAQVHWGADKASFDAQILDVHSNGVFIVPASDTNLEPLVGQAIQIKAVRPRRHDPILVEGTVKWFGRSDRHDSEGIGVSFSERVPAMRVESKFAKPRLLKLSVRPIDPSEMTETTDPSD